MAPKNVALAFALAAAFALLGAAQAEKVSASGLQISGGTEVAPDRYRWVASLRQRVAGNHMCGGALVHERVVLTAASCLSDDWLGLPTDELRFPEVRLNAFERNGGAYEARSTAVTAVHAGWSPSKSNGVLDDIALLLLDAPSKQPPIRLPNATLALAAMWGTNLTALGWGDWGQPGLPPALREVPLALHNTTTCAAFYPEWPEVWNASAALCAGGGPGLTKAVEGTCGSDAGGPLLLPGSSPSDDLLVGVSSFNGIMACGAPIEGDKEPSGFTSAAAYAAWIEGGIQALLSKAPKSAGEYAIWANPALLKKKPPSKKRRPHKPRKGKHGSGKRGGGKRGGSWKKAHKKHKQQHKHKGRKGHRR